MDDIIEKKPSSPITTSLLVIAVVCMLAACSLMFIELVELKGDSDSIEAQKNKYAGLMNRNPDIVELRRLIKGIATPKEGGGTGAPDTGDPVDVDPDDADSDKGDG